MDKSMFLHSQGLRTEVYWAVQKLERIPYKGKMVDVKKLKEKGIIPSHRLYRPYVAERLMKTNSRIEEIYRSQERRQELFESMFETYNAEAKLKNLQILDPKKKNDQKKFQEIFAERMGKNLAVLFETGYMHLALHSSNITLAAEIADIGPMTHVSSDEQNKLGWNEMHNGLNLGHIKDIRDVCQGLKYLRSSFEKLFESRLNRDEYVKFLVQGVTEQLKISDKEISDDRKKAFILWVEKIANIRFVEGRNLPSLSNNTIDTWGIDINE